MVGWIKLHRALSDHWIAQDPVRLSVWVRLLLEANFKDATKLFNGSKLTIKRGELVFGLNAFSAKSGVSIAKLRRILDEFEGEGMISRQKTNKYSVISITCYESYQCIDSQDAGKEQAKRKQNATLEEGKEEEESKEEKHKPKFNFKKSLIEKGVDVEVAEAWLAVRKKKGATNSQVAFKRVSNQIEEAGLDFNSAIEFAAAKDWKGFEADWYLKENPIIDLPYDEIANEFNKLNNLADCLAMTNKRKALIAESWQQSTNHQNIKFWSSYFNYVSNNSQSFEEWQLGFDYLININHMIKIIEKARAAA